MMGRTGLRIKRTRDEGLAKRVRIRFASVGDCLRLRRLTCGKALPFRQMPPLDKLLRAG